MALAQPLGSGTLQGERWTMGALAVTPPTGGLICHLAQHLQRGGPVREPGLQPLHRLVGSGHLAVAGHPRAYGSGRGRREEEGAGLLARVLVVCLLLSGEALH